VLADVGQIEQFLAARQLALTDAARNLFLDWLWDDLFATLNIELGTLRQGKNLGRRMERHYAARGLSCGMIAHAVPGFGRDARLTMIGSHVLGSLQLDYDEPNLGMPSR
jgi:hypothetical protein